MECKQMTGKEIAAWAANFDERARTLCRSAFVTITFWRDRVSIGTCSSQLPLEAHAETVEEAVAAFESTLHARELYRDHLAATLGIEAA